MSLKLEKSVLEYFVILNKVRVGGRSDARARDAMKRFEINIFRA